MKKFLIVLAIVVIMSVSATAQAATFVDTLACNQFMNETGETHWFNFNLDTDILTVGDVNPTDVVTDALLAINFTDDKASIWGVELCWDDLLTEYVKVGGDIATQTFEVDTGLWSIDVTGQLVNDHQLDVKVVRKSGDFWLGNATLSGSTNPVPEPMTMLLFGPALLGLIGLKKKK
ncbi:MAG: PEP-CTERM sorting domain-containing protein [Candidatus Omnitrophota bacterium]